MKDFSQVYVIGDIHGCKDLLEKIHKKIVIKSINAEGHKILIYLGDYVDRGSKVKETIETIINFNPKNFKCIFIKGNHEQMLLDFLYGKSESLTMWLYNGGAETLKSYCGNEISKDLTNSTFRKYHIREKFCNHLPNKHLNFFNDLQIFYSWKDYFFVHAGIDPNRPLSKQRNKDMLWTRNPNFLLDNKPFEKMIVHGHTPNEIVEEKSNRINLDTGAVYPELGKLSCMFIDVKKIEENFLIMTDYKAKFQIGQIIHHKLFHYTGVIFDIDPIFQSSEEWYEQVARSRPPKNKPWYHVLVHTAEHSTYVTEQNLDLEENPKAIQHPLINTLFTKFDGSQYHLKNRPN